PHVFIVDRLGLNDLVVARNPVHKNQLQRWMAHDRKPPEGYIQCFRPNVHASGGRAWTSRRPVPLTAEEIVACEERFLAQVEGRAWAADTGADPAVAGP